MKLKLDASWLLNEIENTAEWRFKMNYEQSPQLNGQYEGTYLEEDKRIEKAFSKVKETKEWEQFRKVTIDGYVKKLSLSIVDNLTNHNKKDLIHDLAKEKL